MSLFFTRRALNTAKNTFSNNIATKTRYVTLTGKKKKGKWSSQLLERDQFVAAVKAEASSDDVLIYVHGFNTSQVEMLERQAMIEAGLRAKGYRGAVIGYDWPSEGKAGIGAYRRDLEAKAMKVGRYLVEDGVLAFLDAAWRPRVHLMAHSMGAFMIIDGFSKFGDSSGPGTVPWRVDQVLMASGDANKRDFEKGAAGSLVLKHHARRVTNYYSNDDAILTLAVAYHAKARVGQNGMPDLLEKNHIDLYSTARFRKIDPGFPNEGEAALFSHRWWFEDDRFFEDAALTLAGRAADNMPTRSKTNLGTPALKP